MNLVDVTKIENYLHECTQEDVDKENLPAKALGKPIYTFKMFDG